MKKFTISVFSVCLSVISFAQVTKNFNEAKPYFAKKNNESSQVKGNVTREKVAFFTNDFSNAADWTIGTNNGTTDEWVIGTTVPSGSFPIAGIASTTAANGFALFDSDLLCSGNQQAWVALNAPIDCSAHPTVAVDFEEHFRSFYDQQFVEVSTDGGANWTQFEVNASIAENASSTNPQLVSVDISSVAGGQANVMIRFLFFSTVADHGTNGGCGYAWMIDDITLRDLDPFDLQLQGSYWGTQGNWGPRLPYTMVPTSQVQPIYFGGIVKNAGSSAQADIVFGANSGAYIGTSVPTMLNPGEFDTLETVTQFTPAAVVATNTVNMGATSSATDASPADNATTQDIMVTANVYARDWNNMTSGSYNQGEGFEVGNIFDIFTATTTSSVTFIPSANANPGASVYVRVYGTGGTEFNFMAESDLYTLAAGDLGNPVTLDLQSTLNLDADSTYLVVVGSFGDGGATDDLVVGTSGQSEAQTSFYFDMTDQTWYYTTSTPMVRLNVGVNAVNTIADLTTFGVYPNPATDKANIEFELKNEANATVSITDLSGKVVYTENLVNKTGKNTVSVNTTSFANGVYVVNFTTANGVATQKLVVNK